MRISIIIFILPFFINSQTIMDYSLLSQSDSLSNINPGSGNQFEPVKAFPTAEGFGKNATGGRGYPVYKVTNLNNSGAGSFRQALADANTNGGGNIIFEVAGTIYGNSVFSVPDNVSIWGQTAFRNGGQGITLALDGTTSNNLTNYGSNIIVQYIRLRRGRGVDGEVDGDCALLLGSQNVIFDHCSFSWSTDEVLNVWDGAENLTFQNCIFSEGLMFSSHAYSTDVNNPAYPAPHSMGALIGFQSNRISLYRNLFAHNNQRNPAIGGTFKQIELKNNLMYNFGSFGTHFGNDFVEPIEANIIGNKWKRGNNSFTLRYSLTSFPVANYKYYVEGNISHQRPTLVEDEWNVMGCETGCGGGYMSEPLPNTYQSLTRFDYPLNNAPTLTITQLETIMLQDIGASLFEDSVDTRIKADYTNGTGTLIDDPSDVGGYPVLANLSSVPIDNNNDGIPDDWADSNIPNGQTANNLNEKGYTWLEVYIRSIE